MTTFKPSVEQLAAALKRSVAAKDDTGAQRAADELIERAAEALDADNDAEAARIARLLQESKHPAGYEIEAVVMDGQGKSPEAIALLEGATQSLPTAWRLWELLGNLLSDAEQFDRAHEAFESASKCPGVDVASIGFNRALTYCRGDEPDKGLELLRNIPAEALADAALGLHVSALEASILNEVDRFEEARTVAQKALDRVRDKDLSDEAASHVAELHAQLGYAAEGLGEPNAALDFAFEALRHDQSNEHALDVIRTVRNEESEQAKLYRVTFKGIWPDPIEGKQELQPVFQSFSVIGDTEEEVLGFARELIPEELREAMKHHETEMVEDAPNEPKGVCQITPFVVIESEEQPAPTA